MDILLIFEMKCDQVLRNILASFNYIAIYPQVHVLIDE